MNFMIGSEYQVEFNSEWKTGTYQGVWQNLFESDKTLAYIFVVTEYHRIHGSYQFSVHVKSDEIEVRVRTFDIGSQSSTLTLPPETVSIE
jgi:hypothetical protein